ncbi:hypothetical protein R1flu_000361 [Riccia fluitans]|uniref:Uncharacterized protein n=1 Tax=Riccia fluitans TaxID=41844 RepID=A0ABD1Y078_9MARC
MVRSSTRQRSRRLRSCERQATEFENGLQEAHKKRKVIILNDDSFEECIGNSLKAEWRELSRKALLQLGAKEMTALCQELDVHQKAVSDVTKFELENEKQKFEIEKSELRELRGLRRTFEAERLELVELRCQMKEFEAMKNGHTDVCNRLACQERQLKAAEEELRSLTTKRETYDSAAQELSVLRQRKADYETAIQDAHDKLAIQETQLKAAGKKLQSLRREIYDAMLKLLRRKEQEKFSLLRDTDTLQSSTLKLYKALLKEKTDCVKEKQLLEERLQQANEQISSLQSRIERVENVKARLEEDSATQNRKLFCVAEFCVLKEAKIECLMAKLRAKESTLEDEVSRSAKNYTAEEVETLHPAPGRVHAIVNLKTGRHLVDKLDLTLKSEVRSVPERETGTRLSQGKWRLENVAEGLWQMRSRTGRYLIVGNKQESEGGRAEYRLLASSPKPEDSEVENHEWQIISSDHFPGSFVIQNQNTMVIIRDPEPPVMLNEIHLREDKELMQSNSAHWLLKLIATDFSG